MLLESREGLLFRGSGVMNPIEVWHYGRKLWVAFNPRHEPVYEGWAVEVSEVRSEALKHDNPSAEHYLYYDTPPWLQDN